MESQIMPDGINPTHFLTIYEVLVFLGIDDRIATQYADEDFTIEELMADEEDNEFRQQMFIKGYYQDYKGTGLVKDSTKNDGVEICAIDEVNNLYLVTPF